MTGGIGYFTTIHLLRVFRPEGVHPCSTARSRRIWAEALGRGIGSRLYFLPCGPTTQKQPSRTRRVWRQRPRRNLYGITYPGRRKLDRGPNRLGHQQDEMTTIPAIDTMNDPLFQYNFARAFIEKVTLAITENADLIAADPTLWRQDVRPFDIAMHLGAVMPMEQLVAIKLIET